MSLHAVNYRMDYYVSTDGNSLQCLENDPCQFFKALTLAMNDDVNDTIHVKAGVYDLTTAGLEYNSTNANDTTLTIIGENSANTILDGGHVQTSLTVRSNNSYDLYAKVTIENCE